MTFLGNIRTFSTHRCQSFETLYIFHVFAMNEENHTIKLNKGLDLQSLSFSNPSLVNLYVDGIKVMTSQLSQVR